MAYFISVFTLFSPFSLSPSLSCFLRVTTSPSQPTLYTNRTSSYYFGRVRQSDYRVLVLSSARHLTVDLSYLFTLFCLHFPTKNRAIINVDVGSRVGLRVLKTFVETRQENLTKCNKLNQYNKYNSGCNILLLYLSLLLSRHLGNIHKP